MLINLVLALRVANCFANLKKPEIVSTEDKQHGYTRKGVAVATTNTQLGISMRNIRYTDLFLPNAPERGPVFTDDGELVNPGASGGEIAFSKIGKSIVENAHFIDARGRKELARLLMIA